MTSLLLGIQKLFPTILRMSLSASVLALVVIVLRLVFRKAPKWMLCLLWLMVAVRLLCPILPESRVSLMPMEQVQETQIKSALDAGLPTVEFETIHDHAVNQARREDNVYVSTSASPSEYLPFVWAIGVLLMLLYALISFLRLKRRAATVQISTGVLSCDEVRSPFILGIIRPKIYLPSGLAEPQLSYVLAHERAHLRRRDHWWKLLGYILLAVHWFNLLCWAAYILLSRDIEMACDEKVIRDMDRDDMVAYSQALLDCSFPRRRITACPLAFGEVGVKERVKGVLNYKKPALWIIVISVIVCIVLAVCLMTDPLSKNERSVFEKIYESTAAKMESRNGSAFYADSEIALLRSFADLTLVESPLEPADTEEEWLYRIVYNPSEKVKGTDEIVVSFHKDYVQIGSEYYLPENGVSYDSILEWAKGKFDYFMRGKKMALGETAFDMESLRAKYPEYFDLSTFKGLELYVWQMAPDYYSCGLMPGTNRNKTLEELMNLKGATIEEMRAILSAYDIDEEDVIIIPWQNPISSYLGEYWVIWDNEDPDSLTKRRQEYIDMIREMLFGDAQNS